MKEIFLKIKEELRRIWNKTDRKVALSALLAFLLAFLLIFAVILGRKPSDPSDDCTSDCPEESTRPSVHITRPPLNEGESGLPAQSDEVTAETEAPETEPRPPFDGRTYSLLLPNSGAEHFGENEGECVLDAAAYERNISFCRNMGVDMVFNYSAGVYTQFERAYKAGVGDIDLVIMNMKAEGGRFLMSGMIRELLSDCESSGPLSEYSAYKIGEKAYFLLGDATPSLLTARKYLKVQKASASAPELNRLSQTGELTYEKMFAALAESGTLLTLNEDSLHTLAADEDFFSLSGNGSADVRTEKYSESIGKLFAYRSQTANEGSAVFIGTPKEGEDYLYLNLPKWDTADEYKVVYDTSALYPAAIPAILSDAGKTEALTLEFFKLSGELTKSICREYGITVSGARGENYYDLFGWGDFSLHAYNAWREGSVSSLKEKLEEPRKAASQALLILYERCK